MDLDDEEERATKILNGTAIKGKDEIEVGEYVRTKNGKIDQVINSEYYMPQYIECKRGIVERVNIEKHSKIISEVVEVGDYVNGKLIHKVDKGTNYCYLYYGNCKTFVSYQIKEVLTKEKYMSSCYKVGGNE